MVDVLEKVEEVKLFINGKEVKSQSQNLLDSINPATGEVIAKVPTATYEELQEAISVASEVFKTWKETPSIERARIFMRYQALLREHLEELAEGLSIEQGKVLEDARGDIIRGIEVVEQAANIPTYLMGETVENVARGVDSVSYLQPLGICAGITPFNFPAMIPLWMFPLAIAAGNTFILKPSEQAPQTAIRLAKLLKEAGLPDGVLNVVHGCEDVVNYLCEHPEIKAISFVGSAHVGQKVYQKASASGKRVQSLLGAKNHAIVMPDASMDRAIKSIVGAAFGASGQRCMAISVAVLVGEAKDMLPKLVSEAKRLCVGVGSDPTSDLGPLISEQAKNRVENTIKEGVLEGAELLLDGRNLHVAGYENGYFVGPTLFSKVKPTMKIYTEEIFGPVLLTIEVDTLEEAVQLVNENPYGNGSAIFTESGSSARYFQHEINTGMVGINVPIPVPLPFFSFSGAKGSILGDLHAYGKEGVRFYTQLKTVTSRWQEHAVQVNRTINL